MFRKVIEKIVVVKGLKVFIKLVVVGRILFKLCVNIRKGVIVFKRIMMINKFNWG